MMSRFGVDISSNNSHPINWKALYSYLSGLGGGQPFVIIKTTQGGYYVNPEAATDIAGARAAGFAVAAYLFDDGKANPVTEESYFKANSANLPQADDFEMPDGLTTAQYIAHAQAVVALNPNALVYLNESEVSEGFPTSNLWLADYNNTPGSARYPCLVHQYTSTGTVPGVPGFFDLNYWMGTDAQFQAFFNNTAPANQMLTNCVGGARTMDGGGYWLLQGDGGVFIHGDAAYHGSMGGQHLIAPIVGMATTPKGDGYYLVGSDGGIFTYGKAVYRGSLSSTPLAKPIVGMAVDPATGGYWLVGADGGVFAFGATYHGSAASMHLGGPITGIAAAPGGDGYWLCGSDGGVFSFNAGFYGSVGKKLLSASVAGIAATPTGKGYWLVGEDGGVFTFGDAVFHGSTGGVHLNKPIVKLLPTPDGAGYWLIGGDGGIFNYGDAKFYGGGA